MRNRLFISLALSVALVGCNSGGQYAGINPASYAAPDPEVLPNPFTAFVLANYAEMINDDRGAAGYYRDALKQSPENLFISEKAFVQMITSGMMEDAVAITDTLKDSTYLAGLSDMVASVAALKKREAEKALAGVERVKTANLGFVLGPLTEAWGYALSGAREPAIEALKPLKSQPVLNGIALAHKAYIYDYMGETILAELAYKALLREQSLGSIQPIVSYGDFLYRHKRGEEARRMFADVLKEGKNNLFLIREASRLRQGMGPSLRTSSPEGAMANLFYRLSSETMRERPNMMTIIYGRLAEYLDPSYDDVRLLLGDAFVKMKRYEDAALSYSAIPDVSPARNAAFMRRVQALQEGGFYDRAAGLIHSELRRAPNNTSLHITLADIYASAGRCAEAIPYYDRIIRTRGRKSKDLANDFFARGACYDEMGDWSKARVDLFTAYELAPEDSTILNYLGYSLLENNEQLSEALEMITKAAELEPENGSIIDSLGWLQFKTGDADLAVQTLEKAVKLSPDNPAIIEHLGDVYWAVGREREARFLWRNALALAKEGADAKKLEEKMLYGPIKGRN